MLMWPKFNTPFEPTMHYWLGGISVFGREETLGAELWKYNPNNREERRGVIHKYILRRFDCLTYRHKFLLFDVLRKALSSPGFDFSSLFQSDEDANFYLAWDETEIHDSRVFFEDIYNAVLIEWKDDLLRASSEA
ncbi:hypothetical protein HU724_009085 [Pseudomonas iranensis]|nr:hypothetical protein HU724_009085 [Pseudomonas iranensis]